MSQYAIIPATNASKIKLSYNIATPGTWGFYAHDQQWSGLEHEPEFSEEQRDEIISLGGVIFANPEDFQSWL